MARNFLVPHLQCGNVFLRGSGRIILKLRVVLVQAGRRARRGCKFEINLVEILICEISKRLACTVGGHFLRGHRQKSEKGGRRRDDT